VLQFCHRRSGHYRPSSLLQGRTLTRFHLPQ
jgi:hypothetical protein